MWLDAQQSLEEVTGMRLRLVTDTRLETFAATRPGMLTGIVQKWPTGDAGYELRITLQCYRGGECNDLIAASTNIFNLTVALKRR